MNKLFGFNRKQILHSQQSLGLQNAGKPRKGGPSSTGYVSSPNVKSKRKYKEKLCFLVNLRWLPIMLHNVRIA